MYSYPMVARAAGLGPGVAFFLYREVLGTIWREVLRTWLWFSSEMGFF